MRLFQRPAERRDACVLQIVVAQVELPEGGCFRAEHRCQHLTAFLSEVVVTETEQQIEVPIN